MSVLDRLRDFFFPAWEPRMLTPAQVWGSGGIWRPLSGTGIAVTPQNVMKAAQGACIRLIADDLASLPIDVYRKVNGRPVAIDMPEWLENPGSSRWYTRPAFVSEVVVSLLSDGNTFARGFPNAVRPGFFQVLDPTIVEAPEGRTDFRIGVTWYPETDIMHIPWVSLPGIRRGLSVIESADDVTGLELAAQEYAGAFFRNGGALGGIIEVPGGPETVDADSLRQAFEARHSGLQNAHLPAVLTGGAKYSSDTIKPQEAQLEPLWRHVLEAAARLYHIPPHMLASQQPGASSYASVEQKAIEYVQHAIIPVTTRLEAALSLLLNDGEYVKFNTNALLRGDTNARAQFYNLMLQNKVMTREEVRDKEDLPYLGDLGWLETPNNTGDQEEPARSITISDVELRDEAAAQLTDSVTGALVRTGEQQAVDLANFQLDVIARMQAVEHKVDEAMAAMTAQREQERAVERQAALLPSEKEVIRDERGRITGVLEHRGEVTWRRLVERDATGNVIRIKEVAA